MTICNDCIAAIRARTEFVPRVAVVLGSGLGNFASEIREVASIPYGELPHFPVSTVAGHNGRFVFGYLGELPLVLMQGRVHYYEGYTMEQVVLPIRICGLLGAKTLLLTNAAGGIRAGLSVGQFVALSDHITSFVPSPLIGKNKDALGPRFPDMSEVYAKTLRAKLHDAANAEGVTLTDGVYLQTTGPNFETPAEIQMFRALGADVVGMSTACEAMAARHMGMEVAGISLVTNLAAGLSDTPLSHEEVGETGRVAAQNFARLVKAFLATL